MNPSNNWPVLYPTKHLPVGIKKIESLVSDYSRFLHYVDVINDNFRSDGTALENAFHRSFSKISFYIDLVCLEPTRYSCSRERKDNPSL